MTKISIAFAQGGILPAAIMGTPHDIHVAAREPVVVPVGYGRHLVEDRFAYEVKDAPDSDVKTDKLAKPAKPSRAGNGKKTRPGAADPDNIAPTNIPSEAGEVQATLLEPEKNGVPDQEQAQDSDLLSDNEA